MPQASPESPQSPPPSNGPLPPPPSPNPFTSQQTPEQRAKAEQKEKELSAKQAGLMVATYYVAGLELANAYVATQGGMVMGEDILKANKAAMAHLAAKWCLAAEVNDDDVAAGVCIGTTAIMGGQTCYFAWKNTKKKKEEKKDVHAAGTAKPVSPSTPTNGHAKPAQGGPLAIVPQPPTRTDPPGNFGGYG